MRGRSRIALGVALVALIGAGTVGTASMRLSDTGNTGRDITIASNVDRWSETSSAFPSRIVTRAGLARTAAYNSISVRNTFDHPYGPLTGGSTLVGYEDPRDLVRHAQAAVMVEVLEIGNPHFNSDGGGFWTADESDPRGLGIIQDVRVRVLEPWGDRLGVENEFSFAVFGGQVEVEMTESQAEAAGQPNGAGSYIYSIEPDIELAEGERALLFIDRDLAGWATGKREVLLVVGGFQGKFTTQGETARNRRPDFSLPVQALRTLVDQQLGRAP